MQHAVLNDKKLNDLFNRDGYVIVTLLSSEEIKKMLSFYNQNQPVYRNAFTSFATDNYDYRKQVDTEIKSVLSPAFAELFIRHQPFWGNIFTKTPGSFAIPLHADFQYVEEPENISVNVWSPLVDITLDNGPLGVIRGSHRVVHSMRGTNVTNHYRQHAQEMQDKFGDLLLLKAGEAIIYDHRLLHFSGANNSATNRIAITLVGTPIGKQIIHYYAADENSTTIYKYHINSVDDFLKTKFLQKPGHLVPVETIHNFAHYPLTIQDFETLNLPV